MSAAQMISVKTNLSPCFPVVNEEDTRVIQTINNNSYSFLNRGDSTFLCQSINTAWGGISIPNFNVNRRPLYSGFIISDMEVRYGQTRFCGEANGGALMPGQVL